MSRPYTMTLEVPAVAGNGAATTVYHLDEKVVHVYSRTSGTFQVQVSMDGSNWGNYGTAFTATGFLALPFYVKQVRIVCTVDGTASALVAGVQRAD